MAIEPRRPSLTPWDREAGTGTPLAVHQAMRPLLLALLAFSFNCANQGGNSAALANALLTTAVVVAAHPEMVVPRSEEEQAQMERDAEIDQAPLLVPPGLLGPDHFLHVSCELTPPGVVIGDSITIPLTD